MGIEREEWVTLGVSEPRIDLNRIRPDGGGRYVIDHKEASPGCGVTLAVFLFVLLVTPLAVLLVTSLGGSDMSVDRWLGLLWLILPIIGVTWATFHMLRSSLALRSYRTAQLFMPRAQFRRGEQMELHFQYSRSNGVLGKEGDVLGRLVCLRVRRVQDSESVGPDYVYPKEEVTVIPLPTQKVSAAQGSLEAHWKIELPADVPATTIEEDGWIVWQLQVMTAVGGKLLNRAWFLLNIT